MKVSDGAVGSEDATRGYRQVRRAESSEATRQALLDALDAVVLPSPGRSFSLQEVAAAAGTTVQTLLRHYGSKSGLLAAAAQRGLARTAVGRDGVPAGDAKAIASYLGDHYERVGPMVLRMLAVEGSDPEFARISEDGRRMHRRWVQRVCGPWLSGTATSDKTRRVAQFVAITDLMTWKVLRHEQRLSRRDYVRSIQELLERMQ